MFRPRLIPVLLLKNKGLVKTVKFDKTRYIGDPINAVKIFNERKTDELAFLDITASADNKTIPLDLVRQVAEEAFMPFSVGGGIKTLEDARLLLNSGAEKVIINTAAALNPKLLTEIANVFGSQSVVVSIDVKKDFFGKYVIHIKDGKVKFPEDLVSYARKVADLGAGEIIINSIDRDGTMQGYDIELVKSVTSSVNIPVVALGGAADETDFVEVTAEGGASAAAAGSVFVYFGKRNGVLINYPDRKDLKKLFNTKYDSTN